MIYNFINLKELDIEDKNIVKALKMRTRLQIMQKKHL